MHRLKRLFFCMLYYGFAQWLPVSHVPMGKIAMKIRYVICRNLFGSCGKNVNIEAQARFHSGRNIYIGNNSGIGENARLLGIVHIGDDVMMGPNCIIVTRNHAFDRTDIPMTQQDFYDYKPVHIGNDVWLGWNVTILPGVKIGNGVIVGAGAVVTKDIPDWAIAVGNPAKVIKYRKNIDDAEKTTQKGNQELIQFLEKK